MVHEIKYTSCAHDCGGKCPLEVKVINREAVSISSRESVNRDLKIKPCGRGLGYLQRVYHPNRLKTPLQRVGERGSGQFRPITWDEALEQIAFHLSETYAKHGPGSITSLSRTGSVSAMLHESRRLTARFLNTLGGHLEIQGNYSYGAAQTASNEVYGTVQTDHSHSDLLNSKLILLWGHNPAVTRHGSDSLHYLQEARRQGAYVICMDPRQTESARMADRWIPIRPGTDVPVLLSMAYVMLHEDLWDKDFIDRYTVGFEYFAAHVRGENDGVPKTPAWASALSGVSPETIVELARLYATIRPAAIKSGWGPQRTTQGENFTRATATLAAMTGNIGISGGNPGGCGIGLGPYGIGLPSPPNRVNSSVRITNWADAIAKGKAGGYPTDVRMAYSIGGNMIQQSADIGNTLKAMQKLDFFVAHEHFLTLTARQADIVLPAATFMEREDMQIPWLGHGHFVLYQQKVVDPPSGVRTDFDILHELADRLGFGADFDDKGEEGWLREFTKQLGIPDFEQFRTAGIHVWDKEKNTVPFREQIERGIPFQTPSGKIQLGSPQLAERNLPVCAVYQVKPEGVEDPLRSSFPLQFISPKRSTTTNSTLSEITNTPPIVFIHPNDAASRGIHNDDWVQISSPRGKVRAQARITDKIMNHVVSLENGYYDISENHEVVAAVNILTSNQATDWGAHNTYHTCLVEVKKWPV